MWREGVSRWTDPNPFIHHLSLVSPNWEVAKSPSKHLKPNAGWTMALQDGYHRYYNIYIVYFWLRRMVWHTSSSLGASPRDLPAKLKYIVCTHIYIYYTVYTIYYIMYLMCGHHKRKEGSLASFARKKDSEAGLQISDICNTNVGTQLKKYLPINGSLTNHNSSSLNAHGSLWHHKIYK
jgi:hypothetical protein